MGLMGRGINASTGRETSLRLNSKLNSLKP